MALRWRRRRCRWAPVRDGRRPAWRRRWGRPSSANSLVARWLPARLQDGNRREADRGPADFTADWEGRASGSAIRLGSPRGLVR